MKPPLGTGLPSELHPFSCLPGILRRAFHESAFSITADPDGRTIPERSKGGATVKDQQFERFAISEVCVGADAGK